MVKEQRACGTWESEISPQMVASSAIRYAEIRLDGDDIYWLEGRPSEKGRSVIVRRRRGVNEDLLPEAFSARSRVHEYGGGAYAVHAGTIWFVNDADQQVYEINAGAVRQVTSEPGCRFADLQYSPRHECLYAVKEDYRDEQRKEPVNTLVMIRDRTVLVLAEGDDFYASPALSPDANHLAWISWNHPQMPWDKTTLWLAEITDNGATDVPVRLVDGATESVFQPAWSDDGRLYFVSDALGWWQLYRFNQPVRGSVAEQVCDYEAEMGMPQWQFAMRTYAFQDNDRIIAIICEQGLWRLVRVCANTGEVEALDTPYNSISSLAANQQQAVMIGAGIAHSDEVAVYDYVARSTCSCFGDKPLPVGREWLSKPEPVQFPTSNGDVAHGFYYPPVNPGVQALADELPPLLVMTHGGPTGATSASLNFKTQFWTSRGFAILDVNYRGSTGYGRAYRERLKGKWGVYDVDDVVAGARFLVEQGKADPERLAIRGGSAGGYTTLAALTFTSEFRAGASYYGIGDLVALVRDTHKFEARYLDGLIGQYPQAQELYQQRSPINHVDQLSCPVIFLQGEEDRVVPPDQAKSMAAALEAKGIDNRLLLFPGEQHGFRRAETIVQTLEAELAFYRGVFKMGDVA